jgi:hypothetical protein
MFQNLKVRTKVELFDPTAKVLCVVGEICAMSGMTFHGGFIALGDYFVVVTRIKRGSMKLPFSSYKSFQGERHCKWSCTSMREGFTCMQIVHGNVFSKSSIQAMFSNQTQLDL